MTEIEARVAKLERERAEHELEHKHLRERLEAELRSKWQTDLTAATQYFESLVGAGSTIHKHLEDQDKAIHHLSSETKKQTPLLRRATQQLKASAKERHDRKVEEQQRNRWLKRLGGGIALLVTLAEVWDKWEHIVKAFSTHH